MSSYFPASHVSHAVITPSAVDTVPASHGTFTVSVVAGDRGHFHPFGQSAHVDDAEAPSSDHRPFVHALHDARWEAYLPAAHEAQAEKPVPSAIVPAGHMSHDAFFSSSCHHPSGQLLHVYDGVTVSSKVPTPHLAQLVRSAVAPTALVAHPFGHGEHEPALAAEYSSSAQKEHVVWLASYFPAAHSVHVVLPSSTMSPAPHTAQLVWPALEYLPAPHSPHDVSVSSNRPATQMSHEVRAPLVIQPSGQLSHAAIPPPAWNHDPGHFLHAPCAPAFWNWPDGHAVHAVLPVPAA